MDPGYKCLCKAVLVLPEFDALDSMKPQTYQFPLPKYSRELVDWSITIDIVNGRVPIRSDGTITTVAFEAVVKPPAPNRLKAPREPNSLARSVDAMIAARVVNVLPRPMSSARIPPRKSSADLLFAPVIECW